VKYAALVIFVIVMVAVGVYSRRKTRDVNEFFLGGRDVGPWLSAFAYGTTYFSAVIFVGYAGKIGYNFGASAIWIAVGNTLIGSMLAWIMLAKRTHAQTIRLNAMTMPEYLAQRYGQRWMKVVAAVIIFVFLVPYSASVYTGLGYLFEETFGLDFTVALWAMAVLTGIYLVLGGYLAVARNDLIQGVIMLVGSFMLVGYVVHSAAVGGWSGLLDRLGAVKLPEGVKVPAPDATVAWPAWHLSPFSWEAFLKSPGVSLLALVLLTSLGVFGLPQMVHKFYAIRDEKAVKPAIIISTVFAAVITFSAYFTGALSRMFPAAGELAQTKSWDQIIPVIINQALPELLVAIVLLLILSASMSTLAGLVMISASAITVDLIKGEVKRDLGEKAEVLTMRLLLVVFIILSVVLAQAKFEVIVNLMALSWGAVAGAFIGPFVWGLYWKRVTAAGAWAGMLIPLVFMCAFGWHYVIDKATAGYVPTIAVLAMLMSLVITPLVSLITPAPDAALVGKAFDAGDDEGSAGATADVPVETAVAAVAGGSGSGSEA
jgi:solute:Na+ symporter, SSS family